MFIAHAPAAWLLSLPVRRLTLFRGRGVKAALVVGGVLPDIDMLAWALTGGRVHHHAYATHWPSAWAALLVGALAAAAAFARVRAPAAAVAALATGALLHCALDTVAGDVRWLAPFSDRAFSLVTVPASQPHWVLSFVLHWTFAVELVVCAAAAGVALRRRRADAAAGRCGAGRGTVRTRIP